MAIRRGDLYGRPVPVCEYECRGDLYGHPAQIGLVEASPTNTITSVLKNIHDNRNVFIRVGASPTPTIAPVYDIQGDRKGSSLHFSNRL